MIQDYETMTLSVHGTEVVTSIQPRAWFYIRSFRSTTPGWSVSAALKSKLPGGKPLRREFNTRLSSEILTALGLFYEAACLNGLSCLRVFGSAQ